MKQTHSGGASRCLLVFGVEFLSPEGNPHSIKVELLFWVFKLNQIFIVSPTNQMSNGTIEYCSVRYFQLFHVFRLIWFRDQVGHNYILFIRFGLSFCKIKCQASSFRLELVSANNTDMAMRQAEAFVLYFNQTISAITSVISTSTQNL